MFPPAIDKLLLLAMPAGGIATPAATIPASPLSVSALMLTFTFDAAAAAALPEGTTYSLD